MSQSNPGVPQVCHHYMRTCGTHIMKFNALIPMLKQRPTKICNRSGCTVLLHILHYPKTSASSHLNAGIAHSNNEDRQQKHRCD
ncbi:hypothetical protein M2137_002590 [Parabacteroides sp. PFB2-10]|uniref:hypothetical protein n=1 Tax=Parabacteroides sp. PFB2-10 TaxID=1742405 RepID=UPI002475593E|nr:hypothetical protein [Parabacteroides sp. PFB2-10]MDH6313799.1 hypothetical protein [Parabacteroides sp. PFB2-10]MDL2245264.1 hypothetical protein [Parabacteroides sp. OttesenSCG-928-J18]